MTELVEYVLSHTDRGECQCGKCFDKGPDRDMGEHTADLIFFKVCAVNEPSVEALETLVRQNIKGNCCDIDVFDGGEHNYLNLGAWIGDQGIAMQLMGLGSLLGLWKLLTPKTVLGPACDDELAMQMAGMGMVAIQVDNGAK